MPLRKNSLSKPNSRPRGWMHGPPARSVGQDQVQRALAAEAGAVRAGKNSATKPSGNSPPSASSSRKRELQVTSVDAARQREAEAKVKPSRHSRRKQNPASVGKSSAMKPSSKPPAWMPPASLRPRPRTSSSSRSPPRPRPARAGKALPRSRAANRPRGCRPRARGRGQGTGPAVAQRRDGSPLALGKALPRVRTATARCAANSPPLNSPATRIA